MLELCKREGLEGSSSENPFLLDIFNKEHTRISTIERCFVITQKGLFNTINR